MANGDALQWPQDLARRALAATGGKSTLRATQWLLERRAEAMQQQVQPDSISELRQVAGDAHNPHHHQEQEGHTAEYGRREAQGQEAEEEEEEEEEEEQQQQRQQEDEEEEEEEEGEEAVQDEEGMLTLGPQSSLWSSYAGVDYIPHVGTVKDSPAMAVPEVDSHALPYLTDRIGSLDRHLSIGSSSSQAGEVLNEAHLQLNLQSALHCPDPDNNDSNIATVELLPLYLSSPAAVLKDESCRKRKWQDAVDTSMTMSLPHSGPMLTQNSVGPKPSASLAESMRPNSISEILGQDHLLGENCVLRSLLDAPTLPCIIFGGPPGTGKTSLARLIARSASCRFVVFSSAQAGNNEIQEILNEAKQAKKFGQRTVLFVETMSRFSRSHQESVLPAVEAGYVVFMGATTENPSTELISSLLLRCRVFTLKKVQPDHLCIALRRAICDQERGIAACLGDVPAIDVLIIEDETIKYIAAAADGDARVALNALEAAVHMALGKLKHLLKMDTDSGKLATDAAGTDREKSIGRTSLARGDASHRVLEHLKGHFQFSQEVYSKPFKKIVGGKEVAHGLNRDAPVKDREYTVSTVLRKVREIDVVDRRSSNRQIVQAEGETTLVVTTTDAKEAFQWPHGAIEKSQEIDSDLVSALLTTMKVGDCNAAVYWLARVLESSQRPLHVAASLIKFAGDEIGMADPQALVQAVACYQVCEALGAKECCSHMTQCVVYLSSAPKSDALPQAIKLAHRVIQEGPKEPVPSHLRSGTAISWNDHCHLPASLQDFKFLRWPKH